MKNLSKDTFNFNASSALLTSAFINELKLEIFLILSQKGSVNLWPNQEKFKLHVLRLLTWVMFIKTSAPKLSLRFFMSKKEYSIWRSLASAILNNNLGKEPTSCKRWTQYAIRLCYVFTFLSSMLKGML